MFNLSPSNDVPQTIVSPHQPKQRAILLALDEKINQLEAALSPLLAPIHQTNTARRSVNRLIDQERARLSTSTRQLAQAIENQLRPLYTRRAGKILTGHHGDVIRAWCAVCGEHTVNVHQRRVCNHCDQVSHDSNGAVQ